MEHMHAARPTVACRHKQRAFEEQARKLGLRPRDPWVGGYVDYEWDHLRLVLDHLPLRLEGLPVLEFGCNVGASAILFAYLGARVCATDIDAGWVTLARLNAARHGMDSIDFIHTPDSGQLPFADGQFQLIACNSVLEYVAAGEQGAVQRELDRVLAPGGAILLTGTSNRLWPREAHTGRWLINYLPRACDRLWGKPLQRGVWPWTARHGFGPHYRNLDTASTANYFARSRRAMGTPPRLLAPLLWTAAALGVGPGLLAQHISCLLQKQPSA
ncbi:class I SAM-dependent methyltransferase [Duganella sp. LX20W]|uniref:Class I SAM-dependent methyltransferase n=1 Tax=Rugamonas brunnea TaxID=2758569 RepID=A0A7W2ET26_9BURK|nr:class I SAM-dependent methyltransferase [Rugamonas brunnea]MBA5638110.1 class I SAM-dependent methyltransferase [Rugamonas brunnea]